MMNIYVDESGSINNHDRNTPFFVVAMIHVLEKDKLGRAYKRFVSSNYVRLKELDAGKINPQTGSLIKQSGKMFFGDSFRELKGSQLDREMKLKFLEYFSRNHYFDIYYIKLNNAKLTDSFCSNTARSFNYTVRLAISYFIKNGLFRNENMVLQLDERNEKTETKYFLENYLNKEKGIVKSIFEFPI